MRALLCAGLLLCACDDSHSLSSPVVRVDLSGKLPASLQRRLAAADDSYECRRSVMLASGDAHQRFRAVWRVLDDGGSRYVTAVELEAQGETSGATAPQATALVDELAFQRRGKDVVAVVPMRISWSASKGCGRVSASTSLELRGDDPGCRVPRTGPGRLLAPR